jgi:hypothetical protein
MRASSSIQLFEHHLRKSQGAKKQEWKTKARWISIVAVRIAIRRRKRKPTQGSQDMNRQGQGNVQHGQQGEQDQRDQQESEKKPAQAGSFLAGRATPGSGNRHS